MRIYSGVPSRQTPILDWPYGVLNPASVSFSQRGMAIAGPQSLTNRNQVAEIDAGYWIATLKLAILDQGDQVKILRALRSRLRGGAALIRVPAMDQGQAPWPNDGPWETWYAGTETLHSDDTPHSDDTGYHQDSIDVVLAAELAYRGNQVAATINRAGTIGGGELFSINDRLHLIENVLTESPTAPTWGIWPPIREPVPAGARLNFDWPTCRMRLMSEAEMDMELGLGWQASGVQAAFLEVFDDDIPV